MYLHIFHIFRIFHVFRTLSQGAIHIRHCSSQPRLDWPAARPAGRLTGRLTGLLAGHLTGQMWSRPPLGVGAKNVKNLKNAKNVQIHWFLKVSCEKIWKITVSLRTSFDFHCFSCENINFAEGFLLFSIFFTRNL